MGFSKEIKEKALVAAARHCCVCHRLKGLNIEVHHITPQKQGGEDTFDNAIALCFDCHADAGHYFAEHPKGTKLSPSELQKHKTAWYKIVQDNAIEDTDISDHLYFRHIIFETSILEILKGNFPKDIIQNPMLLPNSIGNFMRTHLESVQEPLSILSKGISYDGYEKIHLNSTRNEFGVGNIPYTRIPNDDEMKIIGNTNLFSKYLFENNTPNSKICKILACDVNNGCGGGCEDKKNDAALYEELYERKYYLQTMVITNISNKPIKLVEIICNSLEYALLIINTQQTERIITLPNMPILPNHNLIIPTAIISNGFEYFNFDEINPLKTIDLENWYDTISQVSLSEVEYIGEVLEPIKIKYQVDSNIKEDSIHKINYKSLFLIYGGAFCGSCPHLFFEYENGEISYGRELFSSQSNVLLSERINVPNRSTAIIIAELEQETTFINDITIDNRTEILDIKLEQGDYLKYDVFKATKVTISGKYIPKVENYKEMGILEKHRLVETFAKNWNKQDDVICKENIK